MAWLREIGFTVRGRHCEVGHQTSFDEFHQVMEHLASMKGGSWVIVENSPVGSPNSSGAGQRAIQSEQGMIRARSSLEDM